jgi:hypothetical protein
VIVIRYITGKFLPAVAAGLLPSCQGGFELKGRECRVRECKRSFRSRLLTALPIFPSIVALLVVGLACTNTASAGVSEFKTYDMMGLDYVPNQHRDKGLEKVPVLYMDKMFCTGLIPGVTYCPHSRFSEPQLDVIRQRALESKELGLSVVAIDIEGFGWELVSNDLSVIDRAVARWQILIDEWRKENTDTKILIYGGMPRIAWELMKYGDTDYDNNPGLLYWQTEQARHIAPIFQNEGVELWSSAYVWFDRPEEFRAERKWQIDICHNIYKTKCYFAIKPQYSDYHDSGTGFELHMDQKSFEGIMNTLKEDGADGFGLWISPFQIADDYEQRMRYWSWAGGAKGTRRDQDMGWLSAVELFLDAHIADTASDGSAADYCADSLLATAQSICPEKISRQLANWSLLKKFRLKKHRRRNW